MKQLVEGQSVCNEKNEKGKPCSGHLKQVMGGPDIEQNKPPAGLVLFRCQRCSTLYIGKPKEFLRSA